MFDLVIETYSTLCMGLKLWFSSPLLSFLISTFVGPKYWSTFQCTHVSLHLETSMTSVDVAYLSCSEFMFRKVRYCEAVIYEIELRIGKKTTRQSII